MSIIKKSIGIRTVLKKRIDELELKPSEIVKDAQSRGLPLSKSQLSNFLSGKKKGIPSDEIIIWLCTKHCINIEIKISVKKYNEEEAINNLKLLYPKYYKIHGEEKSN